MKIRVIITGATGMVGEGALHECLQHEAVEDILVIGRKTCGVQHPKLKEIIHADFFDLSGIENQLAGYNACFFCLGVSSVGMKEQEYYEIFCGDQIFLFGKVDGVWKFVEIGVND